MTTFILPGRERKYSGQGRALSNPQRVQKNVLAQRVLTTGNEAELAINDALVSQVSF